MPYNSKQLLGPRGNDDDGLIIIVMIILVVFTVVYNFFVAVFELILSNICVIISLVMILLIFFAISKQSDNKKKAKELAIKYGLRSIKAHEKILVARKSKKEDTTKVLTDVEKERKDVEKVLRDYLENGYVEMLESKSSSKKKPVKEKPATKKSAKKRDNSKKSNNRIKKTKDADIEEIKKETKLALGFKRNENSGERVQLSFKKWSKDNKGKTFSDYKTEVLDK